MLAGPSAQALGLGELFVVSQAGERLDGRIALAGAQGLQQQDITLTLASKAEFDLLGLERFGYLETLRFQVEPSQVLVSSTAPIPDAHLNFVVRLTWPGGTLPHEYAVRLNAPEPASAKPSEPIPVGQSEAATVPSRRTLRVQPNDTLWSIAAAHLPNGINVQQQMLAILRENAHAFVGNNINGLVAGTTLILPDAATAASLSFQAAIDEAGRQNDAWGADGGGQLRIVDPAEDRPREDSAAQADTEPSAPNATEEAPEESIAEPPPPGTTAEPPSETLADPTPESPAEPPREAMAIAGPPPGPPLADLLEEARQQIREQARLLQRHNGEIARLSSELAALQASREQERQDWMTALGRWRTAALAGILSTAGLIAVGLVSRRRRQGARRPESGKDPRRAQAAEPSDYDFSAPIGDTDVKLNLARAYMDLGDRASAREVLEEVIAGGTDPELSEARALLDQLADTPSRPAQS